MMAPLPRMRVVSVVGTLSSSTHTYSGSLGTSPKRGFLMRSHRLSADFSAVGSLRESDPRMVFTVLHAARTGTSAIKTITRRRITMICRYHSTPPRSILGPGLPGKPLLLGGRRRHEGLSSREERGAGERRDPGRVEVGDAVALEDDGDQPPRHFEVRGHSPDLGMPEQILVVTEHSLRDRVVERIALAEDDQLLPDLGAAVLTQIEVEDVALVRRHHALDGLGHPDEVVGHELERGGDPVGHPGCRRRHDDEERQRGEQRQHRPARHQNVTEGWCVPKTARNRSQISPSVTEASTASTRSVTRFSRPRAARSRASRARAAVEASRVLRTRATRSRSASPTPASTWNRLAGGTSSVTNSLTPTMIRALSSTSRCQR